MPRQITVQQFIDRATKIHGTKYDYYFVFEIINALTKLLIYCNKCETFFEQNFNQHLNNKSGCLRCGGKMKLTLDIFLKRAKEIHNNLFDYYFVFEIKNYQTKVLIYCNTCEKFFEKSPANHLSKQQGCPYCYGNLKLTIQTFLKRAKEIHGSKYDYYFVFEIKNARTKIPIYCPKCELFFEQVPDSHLNKKTGCPNCASNSSGKTERYVLNYYQELFPNTQSQKTFKNCVNPKTQRLLKFDIYIPNYNLAIEIQGQQHFRQISNWNFKNTQERDIIKEQYCIDNKINFIAIDQEDIYKNNWSTRSKLLSPYPRKQE